MLKVKATGLKKAISHLRQYEKSLNQKLHDFLDVLAASGVNVATARFSVAEYDGKKENLSPRLEWITDASVAVIAEGETVLFVEFGTGVFNSPYPTDTELRAPNSRGTFGQGKGKHESWTYYGEPGSNGKIVAQTEKGAVIRTRGNNPAMAMYDASKDIRQKVELLAKEAFAYD